MSLEYSVTRKILSVVCGCLLGVMSVECVFLSMMSVCQFLFQSDMPIFVGISGCRLCPTVCLSV